MNAPNSTAPPSAARFGERAQRIACLVAVHGLPGVPSLESALDDPLGSSGFDAVLQVVERQRVTGHLMAAVEVGAMPVTAEQAERVARSHLEWCTSMLGLERELLRVVDHLEAENLEVVVLKGAATAHRYYPDPALRLFGDNDILLRGEDLERAVGVLAEFGYERRRAPVRSDFDRRFGKGMTLHVEGRQGRTELDVHRSLVFGSFGLASDLEALWSTTTTFQLGGREVRALGPETSLLHAMFHAALGDARPRLGVLRDLAQHLVAARHDPDTVVEYARDWQALPVLKRAVLLLERQLGFPVEGPIGEAAARYQPTPRESRAVASYVAENRSFAAMVMASLPYLPSTRDRASFLRAVALPSRDFASSRGTGSTLDWWRRGARRIARRLRR